MYQIKRESVKSRLDWRYIITLLAIASVFLGSTLVKLDVSFFSLYPLRFFGFVGFFVIVLSRKKWADPFLEGFYKFSLFFLILGLVSILWAPNTDLAIKEFGILQTGIALCWLVTRYIDTEEKVEVLIKIWIVGAIFINLIGLYEVTHQQYLINTDIGEKIERLANRVGFLAPRSIFINQNNYAFFNSLTALVLFGKLMKRYRPLIWYAINALSLLLSLYILISSYSRAAISSFSIGVIFFVIFSFLTPNTYKSNILKLGLLLIVTFIGVIVVNDSLLDAMINKLYLVVEKNEVTTDDARINIYTKSINYALDNMGFGMGPGSSLYPLEGIPPHNFFLQILVEYGVVILLGILFILFKSFNRIGRYQNVIANALPAILRSSILVFPLMAVGPSSIMGEGIFWLWLGFIVVYGSISYRKTQNIIKEATQKHEVLPSNLNSSVLQPK
ncbi:O-antigen ligase family protein [Adhaeribacter radiodurans]|uniref:O-antigen ligase family protein n=1 Tax=Adhaeribacter radiodurans TaxID=2745197 RepID=A0A7L7L3G1_9BACT|nr:O-antigen ligase family protein [Adhaeribacter radiodurans]QMU27348.1 O-antigen ligase family protein [Adhaeribacter radiodurans]